MTTSNKFCTITILLCCVIYQSHGIHPYMTCVGCDTFVQCFFKCPRDSYPGINRENGIYGNRNHGKILASSQRAEPGIDYFSLKPQQSWISYILNRVMRRSQKPPRRLPHHPLFNNRRRQVLHNYPNYVPYKPIRHPNYYMNRIHENYRHY